MTRRRGALRITVAIHLAATSVMAKPEAIEVTVVEVAGGQAYLSPGSAEGVQRGAVVTLGGKEYKVVQTTDSFAAIIVSDDGLRAKDKGIATRIDAAATNVVVLKKPTPLSAWRDAWTEPVPPAASQRPRFVPLGETERDHRWDLRLSASASALLPLGSRGSNLFRAEVDARVHAQPFDGGPALDADVALQHWFDANLSQREGSASRPTVYARELLLSYASGGLYGGLGRMRYAASTLGTLDGARVTAPAGTGFFVGAFGGLLPNPLSGALSTAGNRFGVEAQYSRPDTELRPDAALVVHASTFDGRLDERRLSGSASIYPGPSRFSGHFQVSGFDSSNPWKASSVELTEAGFDSSWRIGKFELGGRFDVRQPERSRWLASFLPPAFLCATTPTAAMGSEPCDGKVSTLAYGSLDAGVQLDRVSVYLGGTTMSDLTQSTAPNALGGFASARVVRIARLMRLDATGTYSRSTYVDMISGMAGPGASLLGDALDVSLYYRANAFQYRSTPASFVQHCAGGSVLVIPDATVLVAVQGEAILGNDTTALMLLGTATWHPRL
jgi:hypothetical protein